ncbi:MAG TPA: transketolase, partial [Synergistetes bacterium]|nr:transketolase [Synergistota bacterium]
MTSTLDGFEEGLIDFAGKNENVVLLHADMSASCGVTLFEEKFPERCFNCGVSEQDMILTAAGLSLTGKIPFACSLAAFMAPRAFDQIRSSLSIPGLSAVLAGTCSGLSAGEDGVSHQMNQDIAIMRSLPRMTVLVPADAPSALSMVSMAASIHGPVYIRLGSEKVEEVEVLAGSEMKIGGGHLLREGDGVTICACGIMVHEALRAADILSRQGISAEVLDCFSLKPLPAPLI